MNAERHLSKSSPRKRSISERARSKPPGARLYVWEGKRVTSSEFWERHWAREIASLQIAQINAGRIVHITLRSEAIAHVYLDPTQHREALKREAEPHDERDKRALMGMIESRLSDLMRRSKNAFLPSEVYIQAWAEADMLRELCPICFAAAEQAKMKEGQHD